MTAHLSGRIPNRRRLHHGDQVATQGAGVGQRVEVDVAVLHAGDGVDDQLGLGRPAPIQRCLARLGASGDHVDGHAVEAFFGENVEGGIQNVGVTCYI